MKKILVPLDFTINSFREAEFAASIAKRISGSITLCPLPVTAWQDDAFLANGNSESQQELNIGAIIRRISSEFDIPCFYKELETLQVHEPLTSSFSSEFDLIVLTTNSADELFDSLYKPVDGPQAYLSNCPVIIIPESSAALFPDHMVYLHKNRINPQAEILLPLWWSQIFGTTFSIWTEQGYPNADGLNMDSEWTATDERIVKSVEQHPDPSPGETLPGIMFALAMNPDRPFGRKIFRRLITRCPNPMMVFEVS